MSRYIDTSKVTIPEGFFEDLNVPKLLKWLNNQPTADVVPRDEFEQLRHKYELAVAEREANVKGFAETIAKIKTEVAREIFEELEKYAEPAYMGNGLIKYCFGVGVLGELKKKYTDVPDTNVGHKSKVVDALSDVKRQIHDKATYPHNSGIDPYISLKVVDAVLQNHIKKYAEGE